MAIEVKMPKEVKFNCVIKIIAKDKEYIGRIINIETTKKEHKFDLVEELKYNYRRKKVRNALPIANQYYNLITYVIENNITLLEVSIIFSLQEENKNDGYLILKEEYKALKDSNLRGVCLNSNQFPIIPKYKTSKAQNKWLTHNQWLNIKKLSKRQTEQV
jgi:hypothetical protein